MDDLKMNIKIKKFKEDFVVVINSYFVYGVSDDTDDLVPILIKQGVYTNQASKS